MRIYDEILVPRLFEPWAALLLDMVGLGAGELVLDVATGPGTVARLAAQRLGTSGRVLACDLSPAMLAVAREKGSPAGAAPIEYAECPADRLSVGDETHDVALCQQGVQFLPDRPAALEEMRRALRPGGRIGISVWGEISDNPIFDGLRATIAEVFDPEISESYRGGPWGFPDGRVLASLVEGSGFSRVTLTEQRLPFVFEGGPAQALQTLAAAPVIAAKVAELSAEGRDELLAAAVRHLTPLTVDGEVRSFATSNVVRAVKGDHSS